MRLLGSDNLGLLGRFTLLARSLITSSLLLPLLLDLGESLFVRLVLGLLRQAILLGAFLRQSLLLRLLRLLADETLLAFALLLLLGLLLPGLALLACLLFPLATLLVGLLFPVLLFLLPFLLLSSDPSLFLGLCALRSLAFDAVLLGAPLAIAFSLLRFSFDGFGFSSRSRFPSETFLLELLLLLPVMLAVFAMPQAPTHFFLSFFFWDCDAFFSSRCRLNSSSASSSSRSCSSRCLATRSR